MTDNLYPFPGGSGGRGRGGHGPSGPTDETRFLQIEGAIQEIRSNLIEIKTSQDKLLGGQHRIELKIAELKGRFKGMEDRFASIPTTMQLISFAVAVFLAAGVLRFFEPRLAGYNPPAVTAPR